MRLIFHQHFIFLSWRVSFLAMDYGELHTHLSPPLSWTRPPSHSLRRAEGKGFYLAVTRPWNAENAGWWGGERSHGPLQEENTYTGQNWILEVRLAFLFKVILEPSFFFFFNIHVWWNLERSWKQIQALRWQQSWKYHVLNELGRETELGDAFLPSINKNANIPDAFYTLPRASGLLISSEPFHAAPVFLQAVCFLSCPWWLPSRDTPLGRKRADIRRSFQRHPCLQTPADFPWTFPVQLNRF